MQTTPQNNRHAKVRVIQWSLVLIPYSDESLVIFKPLTATTLEDVVAANPIPPGPSQKHFPIRESKRIQTCDGVM